MNNKDIQINSKRVYLLPVFRLGDVLAEKGYNFRFYFPSYEGNRHNMPHGLVEGKDGRSGLFNINTGEPLKNVSLKGCNNKKYRNVTIML